MVRRKHAAEATTEAETPADPGDFNPAEFDPAMKGQADQVVQQTAEHLAMPPENGHAAHHAPKNGHATEKKKFTPAPDPRGLHIIDLSLDPKGPKARLLRSNDNQAMLIQFTENPGKEITSQLSQAGMEWKGFIKTDFAKGAWILRLEAGNEWRNHALAEQVFRDVVNQIREKHGMEAFVPGAGQAV